MLNEGRGISELNKIETEKIFKIFKDKGYIKNSSYKIFSKQILIDFEEGNYDSFFYKNGQFIKLHFSLPQNFDEIKLKSIITHEINHLIEIFSIEKKGCRFPNYNKIKRALIKFKPKTISLEFFTHLLYKTLDNEINAVVAQTYTYLRKFNTTDENILKSELEKYDVRNDYKNILKLNIEKFISDINIDELDKFNKILISEHVEEFLPFILNINNTDKYIKCWLKIIFSNAKKLLNKQEKIIKEVIEDINNLNNYSTEFKITESQVMNFKNYLKENSK